MRLELKRSKRAPLRACHLSLLGFALASPAFAETKVDVELGARSQFTDNFYYQDQAEQDVNTWALTPRIAALSKGTLLETQLVLDGAATSNSHADADNYVDYSGDLQFLATTGYNQFILGGGHKRSHDPFGTVRTEGGTGFDQSLDLWRQNDARIGWRRHGEVKGSVFSELDFSHARREYTTNRAATRFLDRETNSVVGLLGYNISIKTGLFLGAFATDTEFDNDTTGVRRSGSALAYMAGVRWKATAKTSGEIRVGTSNREQDGTSDSYDTEFWRATVNWQVTHNDIVRLLTAQSFEPSYTDNAEFIDAETFQISWSRDWTHKLNSQVAGNFRRLDFVGTDGKDEISTTSLRLNYALDQQLTVYGQIQHGSRDSTRVNRDYDRNNAVLGFNMTLN